MPRIARVIPNEGYLHIISRSNNHRKLFLFQRDLKAYYLILKRLKNEEVIRILHYCFMPTHIHLLIGVTEQSKLSRFMKRLNMKYFYYYSKKHSYSGHLWQDRFKSKIIDTDAYFIQCGKYIELNPVRANIVELPQDYLFSSFRHYSLGIEDKLVDEDPFYLDLAKSAAKRQLIYRNLVINEIAWEKLAVKNDTFVTVYDIIS